MEGAPPYAPHVQELKSNMATVFPFAIFPNSGRHPLHIQHRQSNIDYIALFQAGWLGAASMEAVQGYILGDKPNFGGTNHQGSIDF